MEGAGKRPAGRKLPEGAERAAFERCLKVLRAQRSDTEMFAALLLITKLVKAENMKSEDRHRIFEAVGFKFVNRLLNTETAPEDCDEHMFHSVALTLLACFSTDPRLTNHPEMLNKVPILANVILLPRQVSSLTDVQQGMVMDAYETLQGLASTEAGRSHLCYQATESLVTVVKDKLMGYDKSHTLLCFLLHHNAKELWTSQSDSLNDLFQKLASDFEEFQDEEKFKMCGVLNSLLSVASWVPDNNLPEWAANLYSTLSGVLQNKLGEEQRDGCLQLAATMLHHYGASWVPTHSEGHRKSFLLLINLAGIEVRMILETMSPEKQLSKAAVLCSCFMILEQCTQIMICNTEIGLQQDEIYQLHNVLTAAFGAAIYHLKSVTPVQIDDPVIICCVRALFMWLAEETAMLKTDVIEILPFLLGVGKLSLESIGTRNDSKQIALPEVVFQHIVREDLLKLFLPGLCHLTAEKGPREVVLRNDGMGLLVTYAEHLLTNRHTSEKKQDIESSLLTLCNIFLNVTLEDRSSVAKYKEFRDLIKILSTAVFTSGEDSNLLNLHFALVVVAILRLLSVDKEIEETVRSGVKRIGERLWLLIHDDLVIDDSLKNVSCLLIQCLNECSKIHRWIASCLLDAGWTQQEGSTLSSQGLKSDEDVMSLCKELCETLQL